MQNFTKTKHEKVQQIFTGHEIDLYELCHNHSNDFWSINRLTLFTEKLLKMFCTTCVMHSKDMQTLQ